MSDLCSKELVSTEDSIESFFGLFYLMLLVQEDSGLNLFEVLQQVRLIPSQLLLILALNSPHLHRLSKQLDQKAFFMLALSWVELNSLLPVFSLLRYELLCDFNQGELQVDKPDITGILRSNLPSNLVIADKVLH